MQNKYRIAITSLLGNTIEYFGFTLFAIFTKSIGESFFPNEGSFTQNAFVLIIFGMGFLSRPVGALFFGHFGDKIGRKKSLSYTILGMSVVTFLIATLPGYQSLGVLAPTLLLVLRLFQGFFVGGEGPGAALYMLEHTKVRNRGIVGGIVISSIVMGSFLAILVAIIVIKLRITGALSWRIPFFLASAAGLIGLYLRFSLPETKDFVNIQDQGKILKVPILTVLKSYWEEVILMVALGGVTTGISYIIMVYLIPYIEKQHNISHFLAMEYSLYTTLLYIVSLIVMGKVSNNFDTKKFIVTFAYLTLILIIPIFLAISDGNKGLLILGLVTLTILGAGMCAPAYPYAIKKFAPEVRYSGVGVGYTIGIAVFGGFTPVICSYLLKITNLVYSPAFYIIALAFIYVTFEYILTLKQSKV
jgi:MHS family proline/betaine transporter-like MFS transporter